MRPAQGLQLLRERGACGGDGEPLDEGGLAGACDSAQQYALVPASARSALITGSAGAPSSWGFWGSWEDGRGEGLPRASGPPWRRPPPRANSAARLR